MSSLNLLISSILFMCALFIFSMSFIAYKNYKREELRRSLRRQLLTNQKEISLKELLNLRLDKLEKIFIQAGYDTIFVEDVFLVMVLIVVICIGSSLVFSHGIFIIIVPITLLGVAAGVIGNKATKRVAKLNSQFCDSLDDMGDDLRINHNLFLAIKNSLPSMKSPLHEEFEEVCKNVESNIDIIVALQKFADRTGNNIIQGWVDAVVFASEKKSNVGDVCKIYNRKIKERLRNGERVRGRLNGIKAVSLMILGILGGMILMFYSTSPIFAVFLTSPLGVGTSIYTFISIVVTTLFIFGKINKEYADI